MSDIHGTPITITIDGKEFTLSPLGPADYAAAQQHVRDVAWGNLLGNMTNVPEARVSADVVSKTMAEILMRDVPLGSLFTEYDSLIYLLWRSMSKRAPTLNLKAMTAMVNGGVDIALLSRLVGKISGLGVPDADTGGADPLG